MSTPDKMFVTADCATFCYEPDTGVEVLLVQRAKDPYKGMWAIPGGFVELDEELRIAAHRELQEETGVEADLAHMFQVRAFGQPGRDPRGRNVTVAFGAVVGHGRQPAQGADDAADARWFPLDELPELAFDHSLILHYAVLSLAEHVVRSHLLYLLLPPTFQLDDVSEVLNQISPEAWDSHEVFSLLIGAQTEICEMADYPEDGTFRCTVQDYSTPVGGAEEKLESMEDFARSLGFDGLDEIADLLEQNPDWNLDDF